MSMDIILVLVIYFVFASCQTLKNIEQWNVTLRNFINICFHFFILLNWEILEASEFCKNGTLYPGWCG